MFLPLIWHYCMIFTQCQRDVLEHVATTCNLLFIDFPRIFNDKNHWGTKFSGKTVIRSIIPIELETIN